MSIEHSLNGEKYKLIKYYYICYKVTELYSEHRL